MREGMGDKNIKDDCSTRSMTMSHDFRMCRDKEPNQPTTPITKQWSEEKKCSKVYIKGRGESNLKKIPSWKGWNRNSVPWHQCHDTVTQEQRWRLSYQTSTSYVTEIRTAEMFRCWSTECLSNITNLKFSSYWHFFLRKLCTDKLHFRI